MEELIEEKGIQRYRYERKLIPIIHSRLAEEIIRKDKTKFSIDFTLGRYGEIKVFKVSGGIEFKWGTNYRFISLSDLEKIAKHPEKLYTVNRENEVVPIEIRDSYYYKLMLPEGTKYPTLEINGIHMHRIKDVDPMSDTIAKVRTLGKISGMKVLDTCTGLGYTAILAYRKGATVMTIEKDPNVLSLAEVNPWSHDLEKIIIVLADSSKIVKKLPSSYFDAVIHDPPRFSLAGELYSQEFYFELSRVLRKGGKLYHYTGMPHAKYRGKSTVKGISNRLSKAGFKVKYDKRAQGFIAVKVF